MPLYPHHCTHCAHVASAQPGAAGLDARPRGTRPWSADRGGSQQAVDRLTPWGIIDPDTQTSLAKDCGYYQALVEAAPSVDRQRGGSAEGGHDPRTSWATNEPWVMRSAVRVAAPEQQSLAQRGPAPRAVPMAGWLDSRAGCHIRSHGGCGGAGIPTDAAVCPRTSLPASCAPSLSLPVVGPGGCRGRRR